ncbi:MAG: hypothetical protein IJN67_04760 [Oscillospiraceae bacterium]|nr:hypothetical protein [Oscillospiraceae bacterium]
MKKTLMTILITLLLTLALIAAGVFGYQWYRNAHVFVEGDAYPKDTASLDLTDKDISVAYYEELQSKLPRCQITWVVPFRGARYANTTPGVAVSGLTLEDVELLTKYFPNLKQLDAMQCTDYEVLAVAEASLPECEVLYEVNLGGLTVDHNAVTLEMGFGEDSEFDMLLTNLAYLPKLTSLTLRDPALSAEQVEALRTAYPELEINCIVELLGSEYDAATTRLDLSAMESGDVETFVEKLPLLPGLERVDLTDENGESGLSKQDVKRLQEAAPDVVFQYSFDFYGVTLSTDDEEVHIKNKRIGDEGEEEIRQALDILPNCKRFVLEYCSVSNEVLAQIREDYRDRTKVVWRVDFGRGSTMTDAEIIRAVYDLTDNNSKNLSYCEDVRFIDFGHNGDDGGYLSDMSFARGMPKLEAIILSSAQIKDLSPFENCKNLKFMELAFCGMLEDISPLAGCTSLEMLNISFTGVTDLSALDELPLTNLCAKNNSKKRVSEEEQQRFQELHPECWSLYTGEQPYGPGWRYTEDGQDYLEYYAMLRGVFRYDRDPNIPNHTGWYLE